MSTHSPSGRMHPLMAAAAVSVTLVSLIGVAAITGILPASQSRNPEPVVAEQKTDTQDKDAKAQATAVVDEGIIQETAAKTKPASTSKARHSQVRTHSGEAAVVAQASDVCRNCGRVEAVHAIKHQAQGTGVGVVTGAVLGGLLGNHIGGGNGRKVATVAGAVGGGYAGNAIEKNVRATTSYEVRVRMEDGSMRSFPYSSQPGWTAGDRVRVVNGNLTAQG